MLSNRGFWRESNKSINEEIGIANPLISTFGTILVVLLIILLFRSIIVTGSNGFNFASFLQVLNNAPSVDISKPISLFIGGDWGVVDFLRNFLNTITGIFEVALWFANIISDVVVYLLYMISSLLGISF